MLCLSVIDLCGLGRFLPAGWFWSSFIQMKHQAEYLFCCDVEMDLREGLVDGFVVESIQNHGFRPATGDF